MTAFYDAASYIRQRLNTMWSTPGLPAIVWENTEYVPVAGTAFIFAEIVFSAAEQASVGSPNQILWRHSGVIFLHVFVPDGKGTKDALQHLDSLAAIFRGASFNGVICFAPAASTGERTTNEKGNWYRVTLSVPFQYDKTF